MLGVAGEELFLHLLEPRGSMNISPAGPHNQAIRGHSQKFPYQAATEIWAPVVRISSLLGDLVTRSKAEGEFKGGARWPVRSWQSISVGSQMCVILDACPSD